MLSRKIDVLAEKISVPYYKMCKLTAEAHKYCRKSDMLKFEDKTVHAKIMPDYDPDADLAGLKLTIPSWIGSIERVRNSGNFEKATNNMKIQLHSDKITRKMVIYSVAEIKESMSET